MLAWVAIPFSGSFLSRKQTRVSCIAGRFLPSEPPKKPPIHPATTIFHCFPHSHPLFLMRIKYKVSQTEKNDLTSKSLRSEKRPWRRRFHPWVRKIS